MTKTKPETITLRVGPKLRSRLEAEAERQEMNLSEFIRNTLIWALSTIERKK